MSGRILAWGRAASLAALGSMLLMGVGPPSGAVRAQLSGYPFSVGIAVATLDEGKSDVQSYGARLGGDSPFEIGSITKTFTATLFADMIVHHEVAPDDAIERYLPPGAAAPTFEGRHITLADLATQSSGLPRLPTNLMPAHPDDPYVDYDDAKLLAFLASYKLTRAPGSSFEYSNLGFGLLGYLLARRLGVAYADAIRTRILEPLGMSQTTLATAGHPATTVGGHDADGDPVPNWNLAALAGAGSIVSTPNDMLRYARANLDTSRGPLAAAMRLAQQPLRSAGEEKIGYAWFTRADGILWHNGGTAGFRSFLGLDHQHKRAIVILANSFIDAVDALGLHALNSSVPLPPPPQPNIKLADAVLAPYVGHYRFSDGSTGVVTRDDRGLIVSFDIPVFRARLHPRSPNDFVTRMPLLDVRFEGSDAKMTMIVSQPGQPPDAGTRVP